jgi:hypothetical protein
VTIFQFHDVSYYFCIFLSSWVLECV